MFCFVFLSFFLSEWIFFNICVLSQCTVYWIHCQNIYTFTYQKTLIHTLFCLFLKSFKAFSVSLNECFKITLLETKQVRSIKTSFDIFIQIRFAFLLHLRIENFKPESYFFERNNRIWCLNGYDFKLYQTTFHDKIYHKRLFNSKALFVVYKWPLRIRYQLN